MLFQPCRFTSPWFSRCAQATEGAQASSLLLRLSTAIQIRHRTIPPAKRYSRLVKPSGWSCVSPLAQPGSLAWPAHHAATTMRHSGVSLSAQADVVQGGESASKGQDSEEPCSSSLQPGSSGLSAHHAMTTSRHPVEAGASRQAGALQAGDVGRKGQGSDSFSMLLQP